VPARSSNAYNFTDPSPAGRPIPPKANFQSGTPNQGFFSSIKEGFALRAVAFGPSTSEPDCHYAP
jgi:hypothetical protein